MKVFLFIAGVLAFIPTGAVLVTVSHRYTRLLFVIMTLAPALAVKMKFFPHDFYRGDARGYEINLADICATALLIGMALSPRYKKLILWPKNTWAFALFILIALLSIFQSAMPLYGSFSFVQYLLAYQIFVATYNVLRHDRKDLELAVNVFTVALGIQIFQVVKEKYFLGIYRVIGTFGHPNTLSLYVEILIPILLAVVLFSRLKYAFLYWAAILGGMFIVVSTYSRGGLVILGGSIMMVLGLSFYQKATTRKAMILGLILLAAVAGGIKAADNIVNRFENAPESSGLTRIQYNNAARAIAGENLFGVGLNNFSHAVNNTKYGKYLDSNITGHGVCHHIYWLFAAELGYPGLIAYLLMLAGFFIRAARLALVRRPNYYNTLGLGVLGAYTALHVHGMLEWVWRQVPVLYLFFTVSAFLLAAEEQFRREKALARMKR